MLATELTTGLRNATSGTPNVTRNQLFDFPALGALPSLINTANAPVTAGRTGPAPITQEPVAGSQFNGEDLTTVPRPRIGGRGG